MAPVALLCPSYSLLPLAIVMGKLVHCLPLFLLPLLPRSQHSQPSLRYTGRAEVDGGEGKAGSSLRQSFHQDQQRVSVSWNYVTTPTETMQEAVPFTQ
ncbi:hypothetical protein RLOC_00001198 [Lonchura striata]|uniref:Uncharacterized protein n=1 Tax=Lonchura striata TaxID=40157 RepID=A0A218VAH3_9PASE|nr:hypothetical protein RLOC_00001198 [Lonchura striata domestica]